MTSFAPVHGLIGGVLIGLSSVFLMLSLGRIAGICGIAVNAMLPGDGAGRGWRLAFLVGLPLGAWIVTGLGWKDWGAVTIIGGTWTLLVAGFIVGLGVTIGSGCTSGHGICGLARLSPRSIVATLTFMLVAAATVFVVRHFR